MTTEENRQILGFLLDMVIAAPVVFASLLLMVIIVLGFYKALDFYHWIRIAYLERKIAKKYR
jgi:hypothetical protein